MVPWSTSIPSWLYLVSDLSINRPDFWHDQPWKLHRRVLPICTMWFPFVYDLGHTLSVTTQNTRYVSRRYWPHRVSQSSKHMSAHFLIKYLWIKSWEHSDNLWGYTLSLLDQSRSIHSKCTSIASWSWTTPRVMTDLKMPMLQPYRWCITFIWFVN